MFNRKLEVKMVKNEKKTPACTCNADVVPVKFVYANAAATNMLQSIGKAVVAYIVLDTFRQVLVTMAEK